MPTIGPCADCTTSTYAHLARHIKTPLADFSQGQQVNPHTLDGIDTKLQARVGTHERHGRIKGRGC
jgi:hypothetical protein